MLVIPVRYGNKWARFVVRSQSVAWSACSKYIPVTVDQSVQVKVYWPDPAKKPVAGTTVTFESFGEGGQPQDYSVVSNAQGIVTTKVTAPKGTVGLQVVRAKIYGAQVGTDSKIYWGK